MKFAIYFVDFIKYINSSSIIKVDLAYHRDINKAII